jgi:hypothetical protein
MACRIKVKAGPVVIDLSHADHDGPCVLYRRANALLLRAAAVAATLEGEEAEAEPERPHIGFTAHIERAPDFIDIDLSDYFEESP